MLKNIGKSTRNLLKKIKADPDKYLLAILVFLLPFERIPSVDIKGLTIRPSLVVAGIIIIRALYLLIKRKRELIISLPVKFILFFLAWTILIIPIAINLPRAVSVVIYTAFTIFTALSIVVLFKKEYLSLIFKSLIFSCLIVTLFGFYQYFGNIFGLSANLTGISERYSWEIFGFPRIQSTALEPLYFASYLLLPLSILISSKYFFGKKDKFIDRHKKLILFTLYLIATTIFMTLSRGGISALVVVFIISILFALIAKKFTFKNLLSILAVLAVSLISALLIINFLNKDSINKITGGKRGVVAYGEQVKNFGGEGDERTVSRNKAIALIKEGKFMRIIFGIGPGQFGPYTQDNTKGFYGWTIVNNETLELLLETGAIGFMLFVIFILSLLIPTAKIIKAEKDIQSLIWLIGLSVFVNAIIWQYQTFSTLYVMHIWVGVGLLLAIVNNKYYAKKLAKANN